jgi:RNA polymerase sigma factor (sigma-70 family)
MIFEQRATRGILRGLVRRLTTERIFEEDLLQEALVHLWTRETEHPGQQRSWYIQSCRLHLQNYLRKGRSVDCGNHRHAAVQAAEPGAEEEIDPPGDETLVLLVCARDLAAELFKWLTPVEKQILSLSQEGLSLREIASLLGLSHTSVIKRRRKIAALSTRLGVEAPATPPLRRAAFRPKPSNGTARPRSNGGQAA